MHLPVLLTKLEAAELLGGLSQATLNRALRAGRLRAVRAGRRVFFKRSYLLSRINTGQIYEAEPSAQPAPCQSRRPK